MRAPSTLALFAAAAAVVNAQQTAYGQCGGRAYAGPTGCVAGLKCVVLSEWLWQCVPDSVPGDPAPSPSTTGDTPTPIDTSPTPAPTLKDANVWIRAIDGPNFHKYLQTSPFNGPGPAVLGLASTAGQFVFAYGLLALIGEGYRLFGVVHPGVIGPGAGRLRFTFETEVGEVGTYGGFRYTGDAVQWHVGGDSRPNESAWLVCDGELFVNLGDYGVQTPEGCVDQTIHFYTGATATE